MSVTLGDRLREVRKRRGLTQRELARESGVSVSLIRKLEQGDRQGARLETMRRLAITLRVPTMRLVSQHEEEGARPSVVDHWAPARAALTAPRSRRAELDDEAPTVDGVREAIDAVVRLRAAGRFAEVGAALPLLLRDADTLAQIDPAGRALRVRLLQLTGWMFVQTRQFDAAETALEAALGSAPDRISAAATVNTSCFLLLRRGQLTEARELATTWADDTEPRLSRATPDELSGWGWLLLRASAAAVRDNRPDEAEDALQLARAAAVPIGREHRGRDELRPFGPMTVTLKVAENAMINDRPDIVLHLAQTIPPDRLAPTSNNANRHLLDVARAYTRIRQYGEAVQILSRVRKNAPEWLPNQRYAKDILGDVLARRRTFTPEMRSLADAMEIPL